MSNRIRVGEIRPLLHSNLRGVVVAAWSDEDGEDLRVVPLSFTPEWFSMATDRDVLLTEQELEPGARAVAHTWATRTIPASHLGDVRGTVSSDALRVIRSAELIGLDPQASTEFREWRGRSLAGNSDPRVALMRSLLQEWDTAERDVILLHAVE